MSADPITSPGMREPARDLGWALGVVLRTYVKHAHDAVAGLPGGPRGYQVLSAAALGDTGSQAALAGRLGIDRTVMTYLVDDLVTEGLVERRPDPRDRRNRQVVATAVGLERLGELEQAFAAVEEAVLGPLEPAEREHFRELVARVASGPDSCVTTASPCETAELVEQCTADAPLSPAVASTSPGRPSDSPG